MTTKNSEESRLNKIVELYKLYRSVESDRLTYGEFRKRLKDIENM